MLDTRQDLAFGSAIGAKFVRHDHSRHKAQALQQLAKEALGGLRVPAALDQHIEHAAVLINGSPEIMQLAADANKHLVQEPFVSRLRPPPLQRLVGVPEAQAPFPDSLLADEDASYGEDQFDFRQAQTEAVIQSDGLIDDLGRMAEALVGIGWRAHAREPVMGPSSLPT